MIQRHSPSEFREPSSTEMADAEDAITDSYIKGPDRYDLNRYLGEVVLERLRLQAMEKQVVPFIAWETLVYKSAVEIAAKWKADEWASFRERGCR